MLADSILLPKPNKYLNESLENILCGFHLVIIQNKTVRVIDIETDWYTKLQTPYPLYAIVKPMIPEIIVAIRLIFACDLKSTAAVNMAVCTIVNELRNKLILSTRTISIRIGVLKKSAISGAEKKRIR